MIFCPSLNVCDRIQNDIPVILSLFPPISSSVSSSVGDVRNIKKQDLEGKKRTVVSDAAYM